MSGRAPSQDGPPQGDASFALDELFERGGDMGRRMRATDWRATPLGDPAGWPQSLRSALSICLGSGFPIAIYWGPSLALLYNDAWSPIPGTKHPWALGRAAADVWPEIWDTIGPDFEQVVGTGQAIYREDQLLPMRRHGYTEECYFNYTFSPIRSEGARVEGIFNAVIETTFRATAERRSQALRTLGERIVAARSPHEACVIAARTLGETPHDVPFCALYLSDDAHRATLAAASSLPAAPWPRTVSLNGDDDGLWPLFRAARTGQIELVQQLDARVGVVLPGGPWPEPAREALIAPLQSGPSGRPTGYLVLGASPRRAVDEEYRQFADRAAAHVALAVSSATAFEAERQRAEGLAEVDRLKTMFFTNVSHEFRTPLTLMLGLTEEALESPSPVLAADDLRVVHRNQMRLLKLVNALLDFSRIEAGRLEAVFEEVDVAAFTAELASVFRSAIEQAGLRLGVRCPQPVLASVDRNLWEKVIVNLLSNAFKHTFDGEIRVEVEESTGGGVAVTVADTGVGIPAEHLPRIFERFHRIPSSRSRTHEGTGIGLALVSELVRLHHGTISVESEVRQGTTFRVQLPPRAAMTPVASAASALTPSSIAHAYADEAWRWLPPAARTTGVEGGAATVSDDLDTDTVEARAGQLARVLIADDNSDMRGYLVRLLRPAFIVEEAVDGKDALSRLSRHLPDVVLSDVMMPRLDGFGLLKAIRTDPATAATPVILLSARAGEEARVEGLDAGADDYLVKPFGARELIATVRAHAVLARQRRELEQRERRLRDEADRAATELDRILSSVGEGFAALDRELRYVYVNDAALQMVQMVREQVIGRTPRELFPPDTLERMLPRLRESLEDAVVVQYEVHLPTLDRWYENRIYPSADGVSVFFSDVTARKKAEETLRRREAEQRLLVSISDATRRLRNPDQILWETVSRVGRHFGVSGCTFGEIDGSQEYVLVNRAYGADVVSVVGRHRLDHYGAAIVSELRAGRTVCVADVLTDPRTAGAAAFIAVQTRALVSVPLVKEGRFLAIFVLHHREPRHWSAFDVSLVEQVVERTWSAVERARAETELRESRDVLSLAMRGGRMGAWSRNLVTGEVWWSRELGEILGVESQSIDASGSDVLSFVHDEDRAALERAVEGAVQSGTDYLVEFRFRHAGGAWRWMEGRGRAVYDGNGRARNLYGLAIDITERKQAEEALFSARDTAEQANRLKDQFLATLSHELRTPLNAILGYARMLRPTRFRRDAARTRSK